jgi:hypothetical protein
MVFVRNGHRGFFGANVGIQTANVDGRPQDNQNARAIM